MKCSMFYEFKGSVDLEDMVHKHRHRHRHRHTETQTETDTDMYTDTNIDMDTDTDTLTRANWWVSILHTDTHHAVQHAATHCNSLQQVCCNTLQLPATHTHRPA